MGLDVKKILGKRICRQISFAKQRPNRDALREDGVAAVGTAAKEDRPLEVEPTP
jgi:hypothetical protein